MSTDSAIALHQKISESRQIMVNNRREIEDICSALDVVGMDKLADRLHRMAIAAETAANDVSQAFGVYLTNQLHHLELSNAEMVLGMMEAIVHGKDTGGSENAP